MSLAEHVYSTDSFFERTELHPRSPQALHPEGKPSQSARHDNALEFMLGSSAAIQIVSDQIRRVAPTAATVLITGESGTGKEVTARAIHDYSERRDHPFIAVNCGAISPNLIESELFGHEKGSFTGAVRAHRGVFEQADGGTLFLDEVTEMPLELQVKLLRVLETRTFVRVGSDREQTSDVRIVAATNRCPEEEVEAGTLRCDLMYRLRVFPIDLPALRERREDIIGLAQHFLDSLNAADNTSKTFSPGVVPLLENYAWPGNIRELKNVVQRAYIMADEMITERDLPDEVARAEQRIGSVRQKGGTLTIDVGTSVAEVERNLIFATLEHCKGRKEKAANILGLSMKTLYNRLRKYDQEGYTH